MNKSLALYEITDEYMEALDALTDPAADIPAEAVNDTLEALAYPLQEKAVNVAAFMRNLEATAKAIREAEQQMASRRRALENRAKWIREYLKTNMERADITKIESPLFRLAIQKNPPSVVIADESAIPEDFREVIETVKIDRVGIKNAIQSEQEVPGAYLMQSTRLVIR